MTDTATRPVETGTPRHAQAPHKAPPQPPHNAPPRIPRQVPAQSPSPSPSRACTPPPPRATPPAPEATPTTPLVDRPRGRHRKPRPRKVLLAAGGFALAAGVLSLVRLTPDSSVGGVGRAQAQADLDPDSNAATVTADDTSADRTGNTAATVDGAPTPNPAASAPMGGAIPVPTALPAALPTALPGSTGPLRRLPLGALPTSLAPAADATTIQQQPNAPAPVTTPGRVQDPAGAPAPAAVAPQPQSPQEQSPQEAAAAPTPTSEPPQAPAPAPQASAPGGVCVPLIGLCVDALNQLH